MLSQDYETDLTYAAYGMVRPSEPKEVLQPTGQVSEATRQDMQEAARKFPGMVALGALGWFAVIYWLLIRR